MKHAPEKPFLRDTQGATIVEFAVVAPIFFLLMMAIIEFGLYMMTSVALESAVGQAGRVASLGAGSTDVATQVENTIKKKTAGLPRANSIIIEANVVNANTTGGTVKPDLCLPHGPSGAPSSGPCPVGIPFIDNNGNGTYDDSGKVSLGQPGQLVEIRASYPWRVYFPILNQFFVAKDSQGNNVKGISMITATTVVKNEPATN